MNKTLILSLFLLPVLSRAQTDLLILQHNGSEVRTYTVGTDLEMRTIYDQWFQGPITGMSHDSVFVNGMGFSYKEIGAIRDRRQHIRPFGVAGISKGRIAIRQPHGGGWRT